MYSSFVDANINFGLVGAGSAQPGRPEAFRKFFLIIFVVSWQNCYTNVKCCQGRCEGT